MARLRLTPRELSIADQMMSEMDEEQGGKQSGQMAAMRLILRRLFVFICRVYAKRVHSHHPSQDSGLVQSLDYMNANILKPLTLNQLAKTANYSVPAITGVFFKQSFGESPINYLIRLRVRKACQLLEKEKTPITEISFQCGFEDSKLFFQTVPQGHGQKP